MEKLKDIFKKIKTRKGIKIILIIIFFLLFFNLLIRVAKIEADLYGLQVHIRDIILEKSFKEIEEFNIDLSREDFQYINESFSIKIDDINSHLSGIKIKGKVLNKSINQGNIEFEIITKENSKKFSIVDEINSGWAREFEVYVPDISSLTRFVKIKYISSNLYFYNH